MLVVSVCTLILLCVAITYYQYIIRKDFAFEVKPIENFTEDDL